MHLKELKNVIATLPAPPGEKKDFFGINNGTGASGDILFEDPWTYLSIIKSPINNTFKFEKSKFILKLNIIVLIKPDKIIYLNFLIYLFCCQ